MTGKGMFTQNPTAFLFLLFISLQTFGCFHIYFMRKFSVVCVDYRKVLGIFFCLIIFAQDAFQCISECSVFIAIMLLRVKDRQSYNVHWVTANTTASGYQLDFAFYL